MTAQPNGWTLGPGIDLDAMLARFSNENAWHRLGMRALAAGPGWSRVGLVADESYHQAAGIVMGGFAAALADASLVVALCTVLPAGTLNSTIELKLNYLRPVVRGEMVAEGRVLHVGRSIGLAESTVRGPDGRPVVKALGSLLIVGSPR